MRDIIDGVIISLLSAAASVDPGQDSASRQMPGDDVWHVLSNHGMFIRAVTAQTIAATQGHSYAPIEHAMACDLVHACIVCSC